LTTTKHIRLYQAPFGIDNHNKISSADNENSGNKNTENEQNSFDDPAAVNRTNTGAARSKKAKFNYTCNLACVFT
jgi:hypothetical protein